MKKMLLTVGAALAIVTVPAAIVGAQGFSYHGGFGQGDQVQLRTQDQTQLMTQDQTRDQLRLHDGTGDRHINCDGTSGDMHRYRGTD